MSVPDIKISLNAFLDISIIKGTAQGLMYLRDMEEFNKEGVLEGIERIRDLAAAIIEEGRLDD